MNIVQRQTTVDASLEGVDFKGAVRIVNNKIERIEIELRSKGNTQEIILENQEQAESLMDELARVFNYIKNESEGEPIEWDIKKSYGYEQ